MDAQVANLVMQARAGERDAWEELITRFDGLIVGIARSFRLNCDDVADVAQTTWLRVFESVDRIRQPERIGAWIATTARRECLRLLRMAGRERPTEDVDIHESAPAFATPGEQLIDAEERAAVRAAVAGLPDRHQRLMGLLMAHGRPSYARVARTLDMPVGSIGPTRMRAIDRLRNDPNVIAIQGIAASR
jgi:RNA polymerase sigma factor (sigma-70 family)